jgi:hypothetical protein
VSRGRVTGRPAARRQHPHTRELSFMYRYILRESCSQFDSLPLTSLTIEEPHTHAIAASTPRRQRTTVVPPYASAARHGVLARQRPKQRAKRRRAPRGPPPPQRNRVAVAVQRR